MEPLKGNVHSFETFGTVDGPGTRFVVFLQGCPLRCQYCHNPDSWSTDLANLYTVDEILLRYESIKTYLTGGLTISGGEPLMQFDFVIELAKKAKESGIHVCLDTSGITFNPNDIQNVKRHEELIKYIDIFLLDIKGIDRKLHKDLTCVDNENILDFARFLSKQNQKMWIRHVVIPDITYNDQNLWQLGQFIATLNGVEKIELLPFHQMGSVKYEQLGIPYPLENKEPLSKVQLARAEKIVQLAFQTTKKSQQV